MTQTGIELGKVHSSAEFLYPTGMADPRRVLALSESARSIAVRFVRLGRVKVKYGLRIIDADTQALFRMQSPKSAESSRAGVREYVLDEQARYQDGMSSSAPVLRDDDALRMRAILLEQGHDR